MYRLFMGLLLVVLVGCDGNKSNKTVNDSGQFIKIDTSRKNAKDYSDSDDTPTPAEEKRRLIATYNDIKVIDTTFTDENLSFHLKYYALKSNKILVPKSYSTDDKNPSDFATYGYVSDILLVHNKDTVLNKRFMAKDFNNFFNDEFNGSLKKYGSILMPHFSKRNRNADEIILIYSIAIPGTDIGTSLYLIINKNGGYRIVDDY